MAGYSPNLIENTNLHIQVNKAKKMHIIVKIIKVKDRGKKTLKIARERG
jgi:hypothetical protein